MENVLPNSRRRYRRSIVSTSVEKQATNLDRRQHSQDTQKSYQFSVEIVEDVRFYFIFVHLVFLVKLVI